MATVKKMPHNADAERAALGCVLLDNAAAVNITAALTDAHFYIDSNKIIFSVCRQLVASGDSVDVITVLEAAETSSKQINAQYLAALVDIPSAANYENYIKILEGEYLCRQTIEVANEMLLAGYKGGGEEAIAAAQGLINNLANKGNTGNLEHIGRGAAEFMAELEERQRGKIKSEGILSGYKNLDEIIRGFRPCALSIIAARPSIGKTAFALSIAGNAAVQQKKRVAIFNLEMGRDEVISRLMGNLSGVPYGAQRRVGGMLGSQTQEMCKAYADAVNAQIYIDDSADITPTKIFAKCRKLAATDGLDLVIIDYLQLLSLGARSESRQQEITAISRALKIFAKEMKIPVIALSQLSRAGELRGGKPELSDLRESGSIEQDADIVMFLQRQKSEVENKVLDLYVEKNRNGQRGKVSFEFFGDTQRFYPKI